MKKRVIAFIATAVVVISCFVFPASADDTKLVSADMPVVSTAIEVTGSPSYFYTVWQTYQDRAIDGMLKLVPVVKYNGEWCILLNSSNLSFVAFGYDGTKFRFYSASGSLSDEKFSKYTMFSKLEYYSNTSKLYHRYGYDFGVTSPIVTPVSIRTGEAVAYTGLPDVVAWILPDSGLTDTSQSAAISYFQGKNIIGSDVTEKSTDTTSTAEIMTAPQSETDKADGGHLKVSQSQAANGYTAFSFMLNDNSNYHNYSVKISSNTNQIGTIEQRILNENGGSIDTGGETLSDVASVSNWLNTMFNVWSENIVSLQHFDFEYMFNQNAQTDSALKNLNKTWLSSMCKNMNSLTYTTSKVLTFDELSFSEDKQPYLPCKVVSFALSDYINVNKDTIYKVEIIDNVTQTVLDYTYIATPVAMSKGGENYGTKVYNYKDYNTMKNDVLNNDPSNAYTSNIGGKMDDTDPDNGFNSGTIQGIYDKYSINDLSDALNQSVSNATGFVKMCTSFIPSDIMALIVGGIALLILLRVLGR